MKNNTSFNILASYAYMYGNKQFCDSLFSRVKSGQVNLMIDSGAFTKHNAKQARDYINVDDYCTFLEKFAGIAEKYVMLDVVGDAVQSRRNYEEMVRRGFKPMFVATMYDKDFPYIESTLDVTEDLCVAGGVTTKGDWMTQRFQQVYKRTGSRARIHGLGYVTIPNMFRVPVSSVDSSSWKTGQRFGQGKVWWEHGRIESFLWTDFLKNGKRMPQQLKDALDRVGVTPAMYLDEKNHKGQKGIEGYLNTYAYVRFQQFAKQNGRDLFLAVGNYQGIEQIAYVYENIRNLKFEDYKNTKF